MHKREVFIQHVKIFKTYLNSTEKKNVDQTFFTFDDGGISNLKSAEILENHDLKGMYFITTNRIGTPGFLAETDISDLEKSGHTIGSHSHTHPMIFRTLSYQKMLDEWKVSKDILENISGKEILHCSIPGGDSDLKTYESAAEAGFRYIFDSEPLIESRFVKEAEIFGRFSIKAQMTDETFRNLLELNNLSALQRNRKIKSTIKKLFFPVHQYIQNKKNES